MELFWNNRDLFNGKLLNTTCNAKLMQIFLLLGLLNNSTLEIGFFSN